MGATDSVKFILLVGLFPSRAKMFFRREAYDSSINRNKQKTAVSDLNIAVES